MGFPVGSALDFKKVSTSPLTPPAGSVSIYIGNDGLLYRMESTGLYYPVSIGLAACKVATTANVTQSGTQTIDGVFCSTNDRVLCKDQTLPAQNGIWIVAAGAWVRPLEADTAAELCGAQVAIQMGTVNGGAIYRSKFLATDTINTTPMVWAEDYSDINAPQSLERTLLATASLATPVAGKTNECSPDGKSLFIKAPDATITRVGSANVQTPAPTTPSLGQVWLDTADNPPPNPQGAWTAYTPTWVAATTQPVLNLGTLIGRYVLIGKTCHYRIRLVFGSNTSAGAGYYTFGLPVQPAASHGLVDPMGGVTLYRVGTGTAYSRNAVFSTPQSVYLVDTSGVLVTATTFAWAVNDTFAIAGTYEAA